MKKEDMEEMLEKARGMTKEEIIAEFGSIEPVRIACGMVRDSNKVTAETAMKAFDIYNVIRGKGKHLTIIDVLAKKAGLDDYVQPEFVKEEKPKKEKAPKAEKPAKEPKPEKAPAKAKAAPKEEAPAEKKPLKKKTA